MLGSAASAGRLLVLLAATLLASSTIALAAPPSCQFSLGADRFDLGVLSTARTVEQVRSTPPTETIHRVRMILCGGDEGGLPREEAYDEQDQCPANTFVCLQVQNKKADADPPVRTISVVPIVADAGDPTPLAAKWTKTTEEVKGAQGKVPVLVGNLTGGSWSSGPQSMLIRLRCVRPDDSQDDPVLLGWADNTLSLEWDTEHACALGNDDEGGPPGSDGGGGRGFWGWLFILLLFVPPIYLALGIYHNRTTYDAQGWDAVPNREFWEELPANLRDLAAHVFGGARRRGGGSSSSRQGYESLDA